MTFDPTTLTGKVMWLRAKDLGSGGVSTWSDASGAGRSGTSSNSTLTVVDAASTPNGGKSLLFNGNAYFSLPARATPSAVSDSAHVTPGGPDGAADKAFDGNTGTSYTSNATATGWVRAQYASAIALSQYGIRRRDDIPNRNPKDWTFEGSNDGSTWTTLDTRSGITWPTSGEVKYFNCSNTTAYLYYRLNVTANNGDTYLSICELYLDKAPKAEIWVVVKATGSSAGMWSMGGSAGNAGDLQLYPFSDGKVYESFGLGTGARKSFTPTVALTSWRLYRVATDSTTWQAWIDGTSQLSGSATTVTWASTLRLGDNTYPSYFNGGRVAEVLIRDAVSTTDEVSWLIDYFNHEHGLTVAGGVDPSPTGAIAATLPGLTAASAGTVTSPAITGPVAATLPGFSAAVAGSVTVPTSTGVVAATLPGLGASSAGTTGVPVYSGPVAATLPGLSTAIAGTHVSNDVVGAVAATLPGLGASAAGTALPPPVTGDVAATLPGLSAAAAGDLADPPTTGVVTATLPGLSADVSGGIPVVGAVAATMPALIAALADAGGNVTAAVAATMPPLSAGVVGTQPTVHGTPSPTSPTVLPFVTSGYATSAPPLAVPPPGVTERPIMRASRIVPDLRTIEGVIIDDANQPRLPDAIYDALPLVEEEIGVPHIVWRNPTSHIDGTYLRGKRSKLLTDRREEPFGDTTFAFELPGVSSMDAYPDEETDPLFFTINRANVQIELVKSDGSRRIAWTGHIVSHDIGNSESEPIKRIECVGTMFQASTDRMRPPPFLDPTDIGTLMSKALNNYVTSRRYPTMDAPSTGIMSRQRGSWADSPLAYVQGLLSTAWTVDGRQWTVAKVEGSTRTYEIRLKKTAPEWTVTNGARGVSVDLTRDGASVRNVIYGHGVGPDGNAWFNYHYPNLHADTAPAYPFASPSSVITVGTTDAMTTSGKGVSDWQRRARNLGYQLAIDGAFNSSDATVARTVQRRFGISIDGVVGPQTWNATFGVGSNAGDLSAVIRLPLAADPQTQRYLYNADGSISGPNPDFEVNVITYADDIDFGTGITRAEGIASAQQIVDREKTPGLTGRITLTQDPREGSRMLIPPGDKITLIGFEGSDRVLHITAVERDWQTGAVTLEVDEKSRDAMTIAQIHTRDKEARRDPARRPGNPNKRSRLDTDQVVPFDGESGAGVIPKLALYGGLWSVIRIPVSETGRVAKMHLEAGAPFAIAFFGAPITPAHLVSYVGNPLASDSPFQPHEKELDAHWFIEGFGQKGQRCGYYPGSEGDSTGFTGVEEQGGFEYTSSRAPWIWVAMYAASSCFLEGHIYPDTVV